MNKKPLIQTLSLLCMFSILPHARAADAPPASKPAESQPSSAADRVNATLRGEDGAEASGSLQAATKKAVDAEYAAVLAGDQAKFLAGAGGDVATKYADAAEFKKLSDERKAKTGDQELGAGMELNVEQKSADEKGSKVSIQVTVVHAVVDASVKELADSTKVTIHRATIETVIELPANPSSKDISDAVSKAKDYKLTKWTQEEKTIAELQSGK